MNPTSMLQSTRPLIPVPHRTQALAARLGLHGRKRTLHGFGGRDIAAGAAALAGFVGPALWARAAGDLRDVAMRRIGRRAERHTARNISIAVGAVAGIALINLGVVAWLASRARR